MNHAETIIKSGRIRTSIREKHFEISVKIGSPILQPEYIAWLAAATALGYGLPTDAEQLAQSNFIKALKTFGFYSRMKFGNLYGFGSLGFGNIDIPSPAKKNTVNGSVTYTAGQGIKSGGGFLTAPFVKNENAGIELNSTFVTYISEVSTTDLGGDPGCWSMGPGDNSTVTLLPYRNPGNPSGSSLIYSTSFGANFSSNNHKGLYVGTSNGWPLFTRMYKDGVKTNVASQNIVAPNTSPSLLILKGAFGGLYPINMGAMLIFDAFNDADELAFRTIFNTYKTAIGLP
jgi:hypothetical protein